MSRFSTKMTSPALDDRAAFVARYQDRRRVTERLCAPLAVEDYVVQVMPDVLLSEGWRTVQERGWDAPLYWERSDGEWRTQTLAGLQPLDLHAPLSHVSYFEADAYARWRGARLPTEQEWEHAAAAAPVDGNFQESGLFEPRPREPGGHGLDQIFGDVWEWTRSPYTAYPGYRPADGAVGEYNGKFMVNQMVLRGGSCATPRSHVRASYRNFFPPDARWQFAGIRLADDA